MYEDYYQLQARPFRLSPDPRFFYASPAHEQTIADLHRDLSRGEGFVVVTGAPGTGKTTLAQAVIGAMDPSRVVIAHIATTQLDADNILRMVSAALNLPYEGMGNAGLMMALGSFLLEQAEQQRRVLLVIDEAQNLPGSSLEELRVLSNLQVGDKVMLQTLLLGQDPFRQMLEQEDLEQLSKDIIASYHLGELAADDCQLYIESRLKQVGWQGDPRFTTEVYEEIYRYTQGVPRRINMICDRLMLFGCLEHHHEINTDLFRQVTDEIRHGALKQPEGRSLLRDDDELAEGASLSQPLPPGKAGHLQPDDLGASHYSTASGMTIEEIDALGLDLDFELIPGIKPVAPQSNKSNNRGK